MIVVLPQLLRAGDQLALRDPLLEVVDFARQLEQTQRLVQLGATLARQVLKSSVQLVHLGLLHGDLFAVQTITVIRQL